MQLQSQEDVQAHSEAGDQNNHTDAMIQQSVSHQDLIPPRQSLLPQLMQHEQADDDEEENKEEQKDENEINQDIGQYDPNEIKGLLLALRL